MRGVNDRRDPAQLIGESLREVAVLAIVFFTLEAYFKGNFDWWSFIIVASLAIVLFWRGVLLETGGGF
jgi:hypothetical protein